MIAKHTKIREVLDCKLAASMINSYLPKESVRAVNWEHCFFVSAGDLLRNVVGKLRPAGSTMPKVLYFMNDFYLYLTIDVNQEDKPYLFAMPDVKTAMYA